jgi:hypothetical protein
MILGFRKHTDLELRQRAMERNDRKRECRITETELRNAELPRLAFVPFIKLTPDSKYRMMEVSQ